MIAFRSLPNPNVETCLFDDTKAMRPYIYSLLCEPAGLVMQYFFDGFGFVGCDDVLITTGTCELKADIF